MSKNRFAGLQAVKKLNENKKSEIANGLNIKGTTKLPAQINLNTNGNDSATTPRRGRPNGKRSNSDYQQVTAYIRRDTYRKVSIQLLEQDNKGEFSELVEELLQQWLER